MLFFSLIPSFYICAFRFSFIHFKYIFPGVIFNYSFSTLPIEGYIGFKPYSDTYWPDYQRGIANRWNSAGRLPNFGQYSTYSLSELRRLSQRQLGGLSPAEKFDIFNQRFDYPTVKTEWSRTSPTSERWIGLCDGWATASLSYFQPNAVTIKTPDGLMLPFGSADVKALLSYFLVMYAKLKPMIGVGGRCDGNLFSTVCQDINAGSFHVLLANLVGKQKIGFVFDRDEGREVWNHPLAFYKSKILRASPSTVTLQTSLLYSDENLPNYEAGNPKMAQQDLLYAIDLDTNGNIIGGSYLSKHPDSAWMLPLPEFDGYFAPLEAIYNASVGYRGTRRPTTKGPVLDNENFRKLSGPTGGFGFMSGSPLSSLPGPGAFGQPPFATPGLPFGVRNLLESPRLRELENNFVFQLPQESIALITGGPRESTNFMSANPILGVWSLSPQPEVTLYLLIDCKFVPLQHRRPAGRAKTPTRTLQTQISPTFCYRLAI